MIIDYWEPSGLLVTRYIGVITGDDLVQSALMKSGDIRFDKVKYIVGDWTLAQKIKMGPEDVKTLVACLRPISRIIPDARSCSLVNHDPTGNALIAWYKFLTEDLSWEVAIMHSHQEVCEWCPMYRQFLDENEEFLTADLTLEDFDNLTNDDIDQ